MSAMTTARDIAMTIRGREDPYATFLSLASDHVICGLPFDGPFGQAAGPCDAASGVAEAQPIGEVAQT